MINICTFKWGTKYTVEHVARLRRMLARNLTIPYQFTLISDQPYPDRQALEYMGLDVRVVRLWDSMREAKLCGVRLRAFSRDVEPQLGKRFCWVDLDVVITGNVDHIFGRPEPFVGLATPRGPLHYNGSLIMMDAGARASVYAEWTPERYASLVKHYQAMGMKHGGQSDEGWMTYCLGGEEERFELVPNGIRYFKHLRPGPLDPSVRLVVMNGLRYDPSMPALQASHPWIKEHWR